jgi:hypothetical protein
LRNVLLSLLCAFRVPNLRDYLLCVEGELYDNKKD